VSISAQQYCGEGSVAHAVQVKFARCGEVPDNVSVYEGEDRNHLLALTKALSGYWEADTENLDPAKLKLCSPECTSSSSKGCAPLAGIFAIEREPHHRVCAARYVIDCTEPVWKLHVEIKPKGLWVIVYKRTRGSADRKAEPEQGGKTAPFDFCDLAYDERVELHLQGTVGTIPLATIYRNSFERGETIELNREELVRRLQTLRGTKHALSPDERDRIPTLIRFKIIVPD
jgi:hypothetical protein